MNKNLTFHKRLGIKLAKSVVGAVTLSFSQIWTRWERLARATLLAVREGCAVGMLSAKLVALVDGSPQCPTRQRSTPNDQLKVTTVVRFVPLLNLNP